MKASDVEGLIRKTANRIGVDIRRHRPDATEAGRLSVMLENHGVDLVLDVGANTGQFAQALRDAGYTGRLVSFEPLSTAHTELLQASERDPRWEIAPRVAIGDHEGTIRLHVSGNSVSSSVLDMLGTHAAAAPNSSYVATETVPLSQLDTMAREYVRSETALFIKIDTQGYEDRVLDGATQLLSTATGLQLEMSFVPLYEGQQLFHGLVERLRAMGFSIWAIWPGFCNPATGRMLQVDVTFFRD